LLRSASLTKKQKLSTSLPLANTLRQKKSATSNAVA